MKKVIQLVAGFMILLVVSLPLVFAQELSVTRYSGEDDVNGFIRMHDNLYFDVLAKIPGEDVIDPQQVRLHLDEDYTFFDECTREGDTQYYKCIYRDQVDIYSPQTFRIALHNDDDILVKEEYKTLIVDNLEPELKSFTAEPNITSGTVTLDYKAVDYGLEYGETANCSGIRAIVFSVEGTAIVTETGKAGKCIQEDSVDYTFDTQGPKTICAVAKDFLNMESTPMCVDVLVDNTPPDITDFGIFDTEGFRISHVRSGEERLATVSIKIIDDGEIESVTGDFSQINPYLTDDVSPDIIEEDLYIWRRIPITEVSPCEITFKAEDDLGNVASKKFSCVIKGDDTSPVVQTLKANKKLPDNTPLVGYGTPLILEVEDLDNAGGAGIGFGAKKAYLDLSNVGLSKKTQADDCYKASGALWMCEWLFTPPLGAIGPGNYTVAVTKDTRDDLDNAIAESLTFNITYDNEGPEPPQLIDFKVLRGQETLEGGAKRGDIVRYVVRSAQFERAEANFSGIGGQEHSATIGACLQKEGMFKECTFQSVVEISGPYITNVTFYFYDEADNHANLTTELTVYAILDELNPNYWTHTVTCSPRVIDRKMTSLMAQYVACHIGLNTPYTNTTTVSVTGPTDPAQCTGLTTGYINDIRIINNGFESEDPYIFITLEPTDFLVNNFTITCPINIYSKQDLYVSPHPETEEVNITLEFYDMPLGEISTNYERKLKKTYQRIKQLDMFGKDIEKFIKESKKYCQWKQIFTGIIASLEILVPTFQVIEDVVNAIPIVGPPIAQGIRAAKMAICQTEQTGQDAYKPAITLIDQYCAFVNCQAVEGKGALNVPGWSGGMASWCADLSELLAETDLGEATEMSQGAAARSGTGILNVQDSLLWSTVCLCVPGIIRGVEKLRQIECNYATCLGNDVIKEGVPERFCSRFKAYMTCAFVTGELWSAIPFTQLIDQLINMLLDMLTDPVALISVGIGMLCRGHCHQGWGFHICEVFRVTAEVGEAVEAYRAEKRAGEVGNEWCEEAEDLRDELKGKGWDV